ncbi:hypothetical protein Anas_13355 [Armadillidium nasatum]|uniref:Uncharacterized protein n=1 Tax=Armadillidium nasatum TaxID=96803 RepID=A0A5N5T0W1_9CRUS|nr:hypothetical protein Anas_13355 [Armadillidium nasatum]
MSACDREKLFFHELLNLGFILKSSNFATVFFEPKFHTGESITCYRNIKYVKMDINIKIKEDPFNFVEDSKNGEYDEEAVEASELGDYFHQEEEILPPCSIKQEEIT